jgi:hypothetical protein
MEEKTCFYTNTTILLALCEFCGQNFDYSATLDTCLYLSQDFHALKIVSWALNLYRPFNVGVKWKGEKIRQKNLKGKTMYFLVIFYLFSKLDIENVRTKLYRF